MGSSREALTARVGIGEIRIAAAPAVLTAHGVGSCLLIALYDPDLRLGALAHSLQPRLRGGESEEPPGKYVDSAIQRMVVELVRAGGRQERLLARMAGGANTFEDGYLTLMRSIGVQNARSARETLAALGIPLAGEDVGGNRGRTVEFHLASGQLLVYCAGEDRVTVV